MRSELEGAAVRVAPSMNVEHVTVTLWALAALGWRSSSKTAECFQRRVDEMFLDGRLTRLSTPALSQLAQAHLATQLLGLGLVTLPSSSLMVALEAYREKAREVTVSSGQREIGRSLRRLGVPHELEHLTEDGLFSIDAAIVDRRIALEFDGPSHFTTNTLEPLGDTRLRDRLLTAMGWRVVSIPFFEWKRLHCVEQKDAYVEQRLSQASEAT